MCFKLLNCECFVSSIYVSWFITVQVYGVSVFLIVFFYLYFYKNFTAFSVFLFSIGGSGSHTFFIFHTQVLPLFYSSLHLPPFPHLLTERVRTDKPTDGKSCVVSPKTN